MAKQDTQPGSAEDEITAEIWEGRLPERNVPWQVAVKSLKSREAEARTIYLGSRCALSTEDGALQPAKASPYQKAFRQGATIVPRNFYFVRVKELEGEPDAEKTYWAETDPEQARKAKPPYRGVHLAGEIEGRFLFSVAIAKHILPFAIVNPATVVLPLQVDAHRNEVHTANTLMKEGNRKAGEWFSRAEKEWIERRGAKATRQNLYERLDYQRGLTSQDLGGPWLVLYNRSGTNICSAAASRGELPATLIVDFALYWYAAASPEEAHYLTAILNAKSVNRAIKPFQSRGLLGERDVTNKVFDLPIPRFDALRESHRRLAQLGAMARERAKQLAPGLLNLRSLGRRRSEMRKSLSGTLSEIDAIAERVIKGK